MDFPVGPFEHERLSILYETGLLDGAPNPHLEHLCEVARQTFGVQTALVTLLEESVQHFRARAGTQLDGTPREVAFCNFTILEDRVFVVPDARSDSRFRANALVVEEPFVRFYAGAPLIYTENIRLGAFCLMDSSPRSMSVAEMEELREFSDRAVGELVRMISRVA